MLYRLIKFVLFLLYIEADLCFGTLSVRQVIVRVPKENDIGLIFDLTISNTASSDNKKETLDYFVRSDGLCTLNISKSQTLVGFSRIFGGDFGSLEPGKAEKISLVWPTVSLYNRVGCCPIVITSSNLKNQEIHLKQLLYFDTRFETLDPECRSLRKHKNYQSCKNWDKDYFRNCTPLNCEERYFGKRSFYNAKLEQCEPVPPCSRASTFYDMYSNECTDKYSFVTEQELQEIRCGKYENNILDLKSASASICKIPVKPPQQERQKQQKQPQQGQQQKQERLPQQEVEQEQVPQEPQQEDDQQQQQQQGWQQQDSQEPQQQHQQLEVNYKKDLETPLKHRTLREFQNCFEKDYLKKQMKKRSFNAISEWFSSFKLTKWLMSLVAGHESTAANGNDVVEETYDVNNEAFDNNDVGGNDELTDEAHEGEDDHDNNLEEMSFETVSKNDENPTDAKPQKEDSDPHKNAPSDWVVTLLHGLFIVIATIGIYFLICFMIFMIVSYMIHRSHHTESRTSISNTLTPRHSTDRFTVITRSSLLSQR